MKSGTSLATAAAIGAALSSLPACAPTNTPGSPTPAPRAPAPSSATPTSAESWSPHLMPGTYQYELHTEGSIQLDADTARQEVPIDSRLLYTVTVSPQGQLVRVLGTVDSLSITEVPAARTDTSAGPATVHRQWLGVMSPNGQAAGSQTDSTICGPGPQIVVQPIHELLVAHPPTLTAGAQWKDTTVTTTCRGQVAVISTAVNDFRLDGPDSRHGTPALRISRSSEITIRGSGRDSRRSVTLAGGGGGKATLYIDQVRGNILESSSETRTVITIKTLTGEIPFRQQIQQQVTLRP